jgi:hypothetical protein
MNGRKESEDVFIGRPRSGATRKRERQKIGGYGGLFGEPAGNDRNLREGPAYSFTAIEAHQKAYFGYGTNGSAPARALSNSSDRPGSPSRSNFDIL